jgi:hypothetical protein
MLNDLEHPNVSLSDWQKFRMEFFPRLIEQVLDRDEARLPEWFVPLARGVAIASDTLLRKAGYRHGMHRPRGWCETLPEYFKWKISCDNFLLVRANDDTGLWTVERLGPMRQSEVDEVLVHVFGWTPVFARSHQSAMRLAMYCHENGPPPGFQWFKADLTRDKRAVEIARQRREEEARRGVPVPEKQLPIPQVRYH